MNRIAPLFAAFLLSVVPKASASNGTALDRYVHAPDASFKYSLVNTATLGGVTVQTLDLTSQTWRTEKEVDRTVWRHWLTILRPASVKSSTGFLFIAGGSNLDRPPAAPAPMLLRIAEESGVVVAEVRMVPNQPLVFAGEAAGRREDSLITYTWDKFLRGGDEQWPARLPMTKSAVRAMDAVTEFCASEPGGRIKVEKFVVSGESKRGWTTWTTAAVDHRVVAIVPIVCDVLNIDQFYEHQYRAYGFWSPADAVYTNIHLHDLTGSERYKELMAIEEPYAYRDRLTMPKFILNSAGDQFYPPDSSQFYWDELKGSKYLRYVPNSNHSLRDSDAMDSVRSFVQVILRGDPMPKYNWKYEKDGSIRVKTESEPRDVKVWAATNPQARDFRLEKIGPAYKAFPATKSPGEIYIGTVEKPATGWTAFFVEMTWDMPGGIPLKMTTSVRVVPDTLPFGPYVKQPAPSAGADLPRS